MLVQIGQVLEYPRPAARRQYAVLGNEKHFHGYSLRPTRWDRGANHPGIADHEFAASAEGSAPELRAATNSLTPSMTRSCSSSRRSG